MSKKSRRPGRRNRHDKGGAFGNNRRTSEGPKCRYPQYFDDPERCCICGGMVASCPCGAQKALEHLTVCHQNAPRLGEMSEMLTSSMTRNASGSEAITGFIGMGMSVEFGPNDRYGLPERTTRQWIAEHSEPDDFGTVPIPANRQDDLITHATYWPECDHVEPCRCHEDNSVMWTLEEFSG